MSTEIGEVQSLGSNGPEAEVRFQIITLKSIDLFYKCKRKTILNFMVIHFLIELKSINATSTQYS